MDNTASGDPCNFMRDFHPIVAERSIYFGNERPVSLYRVYYTAVDSTTWLLKAPYTKKKKKKQF